MFILRRELKNLEDRLAKAEEKLHRLSADNFIRMDDPKDTWLTPSGDSVKNTLVNLMSHFDLEPFIPHRSDVKFRAKQARSSAQPLHTEIRAKQARSSAQPLHTESK